MMGRTNGFRVGLFLVSVMVAVALFVGACAPAAAPTPTKAPATAPTQAPVATPAPAAATKAPAAPATRAPEPSKPAAQAPQPAPAAGQSGEIKFMDAATFAYAPMYWGIERGYYKDVGITFKFDTAATAADMVPFLATGQLDMAGGGLSAGHFNSVARGIDVKVVSPMGVMPMEGGAVPIIMRTDLYDQLQVKSVAALKGKKVALNGKGNIVEYFLTIALRTVGLDIKDVETVAMAFPDMPAALANRSVDAAVIGEPSATKALQMGVGKVLMDKILPGKSTTVMLASPKLIAERPEALKNMMTAWLRGVRDLQDQSKLYDADRLAVWVKYTKLDAGVIKAMVPFTWDPNLVIQKDFIQDQEKVHGEHGLVNYQPPLPMDKLVDESFVKYALDKAGPWKKQ